MSDKVWLRCVFQGHSGKRYVITEAGCNRRAWPVELLCWPPDRDSGYVVAAWRRSTDKDGGGPELHSIGGRLVEHIDDFDAAAVLKLGEHLEQVLVAMEAHGMSWE